MVYKGMERCFVCKWRLDASLKLSVVFSEFWRTC